MVGGNEKYGFNIEIGLDAAGLNKGLKQVKDNLNTSKAELKSIDNQLKENPNNVELWKKKQQALNNSINETKKKLQLQNEQLKLAKQNFDGTDEAKAKIRNLEVAINKTNNEIKKLGFQAEEVSSKIGSIGSLNIQKFESLGSTLTKRVTLPIIGLTTALGGMALKIADTIDDIADKSERVGASAEGYQQLIYVTKMLGGNADALQRGFIKINSMMGDIASGKSLEAAQTLSKLGLSIEDIKGKDTTEVFKIIRDKISELGDEALMASVANQIFGDRIGSELLPVLKAEKETIEGLTNEANSLGVANKEQIEIAGNFNDSLDKLKMAFFGVGLSIAEKILPKLTELANNITEKLGPTVENLMNKWDGLDDSQQKIITSLGATVISLGPVILTITKAIGAVSSLKEGFSALKASGGLLSTALSPLGLVIGAIAAALAYAFATNEDFRNSVISLGKNFLNILEPIGKLVDTLLESLMPVVDTLFDVLDSIITAIAPVLTLFVDALGDSLGIIGDILGTIFKALNPLIKLIANALNGPLKIVADILNAIGSALSFVGEFLGNVFGPILEKVKSYLEPFMDFINNVFNTIANTIGKINNIGGKIADKLFGWIGSLFDNIKKSIDNLFGFNSYSMNTYRNTNNNVNVYTTSNTFDINSINTALGGSF